MSRLARKPAVERALAASEERFRLMVDSVTDYAILMLDASGIVVTWNAGAERIKGYRADEIIGRHFETFYPPEDVAAGKPRQELIIAAEHGRLEDEGWRVRHDGSRFWANVVITALRDSDGCLRGFGKVTRDLTERRTTELALLASEQLVAGMLTAATEYAIIGTDLAGCVTVFNSGAERLLGYRADAVIGSRNLTFIHDTVELARRVTDQPDTFELLVTEAAGDTAHTREYDYLTSAGVRIPVQVTMTPTRDASGGTTGFIAIAKDITTEKAALEKAQAGERRWRTLVDHLPDTAVMVIDSDLRYRVAGGAGVVRQGLTGAEGASVLETSTAGDAELMEPLVRAALAGRESSAELTSGADVINEVHFVPLPIVSGSREALIVARDVSVARRREQQLADAEERFRRLFYEAPNGIAVLTADGTITQANRALCNLVGQPAELVVGAPLRSLDSDTGTSFLDQLTRDLGATASAPMSRHGRLTHVGGHRIDVSVDLVSLADGGPGQVLLNIIDVSERRRFEERLANLADEDPLTGLANRRRFDAELESHLARCVRYGPRGALLMLDLDNFKQVNDTLGHSAGDELLVCVAGLLRSRLRATDVVARLGGDEFAILLPEADAEAARSVTSDIVTLISDGATTSDGMQRRRMSCSVGVAMIDRPDVSGNELMSAADASMYGAKDAGRNRFVLFEERSDQRSKTRARLDWGDRIRSALDQDRFVLHAQPIMDLANDTVTGAELLLRMVDEDGQLILPGHFLNTAERLGLATEIDTWVCGQAIELLQQLTELDRGFHIEVNLSGHSVGSAQLGRYISERVTEAAIDPGKLIFEITETAAVANIETARTFAERIKQLGCQFALDDFGAGYGCFYYLKHLPFDFIKIDGEFVTNCTTNATDRTILSSIVGLARGLGHVTIAEFVSDATILDVVRELGVDQAQGYHIGMPHPITDLFTLVESR